MAINFKNALDFTEQSLKLTAKRAQILSNNIANTDTPNFKSKDIDFQNIMKDIIEHSNKAHKLVPTNPRHLATQKKPIVNELYRTPTQPSVDGNTVDEQVENSAYMENTLHLQYIIQKVGGAFKGMMMAIKGK